MKLVIVTVRKADGEETNIYGERRSPQSGSGSGWRHPDRRVCRVDFDIQVLANDGMEPEAAAAAAAMARTEEG